MLSDLTGTTLGGFRLLRDLGTGRMSSVYAAENELNPRIRRAIKVLHASAAEDSAFLARFAGEAEVLERLSHPNVMRFYGIRKEQGQVFLELELLSGKSLASLAAQRNAVEEGVAWIRQAALGVGAAHALGLVHRDLKPDSLFLGDDGTVKVLDFGFGGGPSAGTATTGYVAPEVCKGQEPTAASDVYALGVCLYELLLGRHPFIPVGSSLTIRSMPLLMAHVEGNFPSLPGVPAPLLEVLKSATERDPNRRLANASLLAAALEKAMAQLPVEDTPERRDKTRLLVMPTFPVAEREADKKAEKKDDKKTDKMTDKVPAKPEPVLAKGVGEVQMLDVKRIQELAEQEKRSRRIRMAVLLSALGLAVTLGLMALGGGGWWWSGRYSRDFKEACKVVAEVSQDGQASTLQRETAIRRGWDDRLTTPEVKDGLEAIMKKPVSERLAATQTLVTSLGESRWVCPEMEALWAGSTEGSQGQ